MNIQNSLKLRSIIKSQAGKPFEWGVHDCNTFFIDIHDKMYGTNDIQQVRDQYATRRGAIKFLRDRLKLTPAQWLHFRNYIAIEDTSKWMPGDVALIQHPTYASVYIYCEGVFWTVPEDGELVAYEKSAVESQLTSAWRKTDG